MRRLLFFLVLFFAITTTSQALTLSDKAEISVLTCSPGDEAYSMYGHTAIRVFDPENALNVVYNYGTFNVSDPNFYVNFCKGWLKYYLSIEDFDGFCNYYRETKQTVWQQQLLFSKQQKQALFDALEINRQPQNKFYNYDFFLDNCATRVYDIIAKVCDEQVVLVKKVGDTRFRYGINEHQDRKQPWLGVAIGLVLTHRADRIMTPRQETFLPLYLKKHLESASYHNAPLVAATETLVPPSATETPENGISPNAVFLSIFLFFITLAIIEILTKRHLLMLSRILAGIFSFMAIFLIALWIYSDLLVVTYNLNIIWTIASAILFFSFNKSKIRKIALFIFALLVIQLIFNQLLPQAISIQSMLLSGVVISRIMVAWYFGNRNSQERIMKYE